MVETTPIIVETESFRIFSILRTVSNSHSLFVLVPAITGTRIGPQRIFVEIARELSEIGYSSVCIDLPYNSDSYINDTRKYDLFELYEKCIESTISKINADGKYEKISLLSISYGCIPVFNYAIKRSYENVILLSPNHVFENGQLVNERNLRRYLKKIFHFDTWKKLILLKIDYKSIFSNIFNVNTNSIQDKKNHENEAPFIPAVADVNTLCIFGEKDPEISMYQKFWKEVKMKLNLKGYQEFTVQNSCHSFFGWDNKRKVIDIISDWLKNK